ncbi:MAG TPA: ABC transporter ATP-binding protein [Casimicrobiaceae bacterium]|nr:ABC transporter ATP-binding protein [Casimicrobiaceae bacterium]
MPGLPVKIKIADLTLDYVNAETGVRHRAVQHLDLDVRANEFLCVVGPSGCGKSTLLAAIAGFLKPSAGTLAMDGRAITGPGADRGVVFQEYALLPWMNVLDNAALGLKLRNVPRQERYTIARRYLALANLHGVEHKFPHELSGGMRQRVAVARTLANSPEVMLMDEPFAAVDAQTRMVLQEELMRISERSALTVVFITHSVEEAIFLGDRVAVMSPGPGRVLHVVDVPFAKASRTWKSLNADPAFAALREALLDLVRTPVGVAAASDGATKAPA